MYNKKRQKPINKMLFQDRLDAANKLIPHLKQYTDNKNVIVLGLIRGGFIVAYEIAKQLNLPIDIIVPRKISAPQSKELAIGAICDGSEILDDILIKELNVSQKYIKSEIEKEKKIAEQRIRLYRKKIPLQELKNKTVILVDDGIATGSTMIAAIKAVKNKHPKNIIVAIPVGPSNIKEFLEADNIICPYTPDDFFSIGEYYENFEQIEDQEIINLLENK